jgi:CRP-like cAMP-binding protein
MLITVVIFYTLLVVPFNIAFSIGFGTGYRVLDLCIDGLFFIDVIFNFNMSYVDNRTGETVTDRRKIAQNYVKLWFWIDFISCIPFDTILDGIFSHEDQLRSVHIIRISRMAKLVKVIRIIKFNRLRSYGEVFSWRPLSVSFTKLLGQMLILAHVLACFWYYIATNDVTGDNRHDDQVTGFTRTWVNENGLERAQIVDKYIASLYWVLATIVTVGYGDIHATNSRERIYSIFTMLCGSVMMGAVISQVTRLMAGKNPQGRAFKEKMDELKSYLSQSLPTLPSEIKFHTIDAYSYYLRKKTAFGEAEIFGELPVALLSKLVKNVYEHEIQKINLFRTSDTAFVLDLVAHSRPFHAKIGQNICQQGDIAVDVIFLLRGLIRVIINDGTHDIVIGYVTQGSHFGDIEISLKSTYIATYEAVIPSSLLAISADVLHGAIARNISAGTIFEQACRERYDSFVHVCKNDIKESTVDNSPKMLAMKRRSSLASVMKSVKPPAITPTEQVKRNLVMSPTAGVGPIVDGRVLISPRLNSSTNIINASLNSVSSSTTRNQVSNQSSAPNNAVEDQIQALLHRKRSTFFSFRNLRTSSQRQSSSAINTNGNTNPNSNINPHVERQLQDIINPRAAGSPRITGASPSKSSRKQIRNDSLNSQKESKYVSESESVKSDVDIHTELVAFPSARAGGLTSPLTTGNMKKNPIADPMAFGVAPHQSHPSNLAIADELKLPIQASDQASAGYLDDERAVADHQMMEPQLDEDELYLNSYRYQERKHLWVDGQVRELTSFTSDIEELFRNRVAPYSFLVERMIDKKRIELSSEYTIQQIFEEYLVIHPNFDYKLIWDALIGFLILYSAIVVPMELAFTSSELKNLDVFDYVVDGFFFLDMLVSSRVSYFDNDHDAWIAVPRRIRSHYLRSWFLIDLFSFIPFEDVVYALVQSTESSLSTIRLLKVLRLFRLAKLTRIFHLSEFMNRVEHYSGISPVSFELIKIVLQILVISHFVACFWWGVSANASSDPWYENVDMVYAPGLQGAGLNVQYITSLYWAVTTLSTTGYGDITAVNTEERVMAIIVILIGATLFGYIVGNMAGLMGNLTHDEKEDRIKHVRDYLEEKRCSKLLTNGIVRHLERKYERESSVNEEVILSRLPRYLSIQLSMHHHSHTIEKIPLFQYLDNESIRVHIFKMMVPEFYEKGQYLIRSGRAQKEILFIIEGKADFMLVKKKKREKKTSETTRRRLNIFNVVSALRLRRLSIGSVSGENSAPATTTAAATAGMTDESEHGVPPAPSTMTSPLTTIFKRGIASMQGTPLQKNRKRLESIEGKEEEPGNSSPGGATRHSIQSIISSMTSAKKRTSAKSTSSDGDANENNATASGVNSRATSTDANDTASAAGAAMMLSDSSIENPSSSIAVSTLARIFPVIEEVDESRPSPMNNDKSKVLPSIDTTHFDAPEMRSQYSPSVIVAAEKFKLLSQRAKDRKSGKLPPLIVKKSPFVSAKMKAAEIAKKYGEVHDSDDEDTDSDEESDEHDSDDIYHSDDETRRHSNITRSSKTKQRTSSLTGGYGLPEMNSRWKLPSSSTKEYTKIGSVGAGDVVGLVSVIRRQKSQAAVRAITTCRVFSLRVNAVKQLLDEHPGVAFNLQVALGKVLKEQQHELAKRHIRVSRANFLRKCKKDFLAKTSDSMLNNAGQSIRKRVRRLSAKLGTTIKRSGSFIVGDPLDSSLHGSMDQGMDELYRRRSTNSFEADNPSKLVLDDDQLNRPSHDSSSWPINHTESMEYIDPKITQKKPVLSLPSPSSLFAALRRSHNRFRVASTEDIYESNKPDIDRILNNRTIIYDTDSELEYEDEDVMHGVMKQKLTAHSGKEDHHHRLRGNDDFPLRHLKGSHFKESNRVILNREDGDGNAGRIRRQSYPSRDLKDWKEFHRRSMMI